MERMMAIEFCGQAANLYGFCCCVNSYDLDACIPIILKNDSYNS